MKKQLQKLLSGVVFLSLPLISITLIRMESALYQIIQAVQLNPCFMVPRKVEFLIIKVKT